MNSLRRHYQQPICAALLVVPQGDYPELRIKAYAGRVLVAFLQDKVASLVITESQRSEGPGPSEVLLLTHGALSAICRWFLQVEAAQRYLTADEASEIYRTSLQLLFYANGGKTYLFSFPTNWTNKEISQNLAGYQFVNMLVFFARFLKLYRALAKWHQSRGILQWALKPKFHVPWSCLSWFCVSWSFSHLVSCFGQSFFWQKDFPCWKVDWFPTLRFFHLHVRSVHHSAEFG